MVYSEIESQLTDIDGTNNFIDSYNDKFKIVDKLIKSAQQNQLIGDIEIKEALQLFFGYFGEFSIVASLIDTIKKFREDKYFSDKSIEIEASGVKVNASALERDTSFNVSNERRARNIFQSYKDICDKGIIVCQSLLKDMNSERINQRYA